MVTKHEYNEAMKVVKKYEKEHENNPKPEIIISDGIIYDFFPISIKLCEEYIKNIDEKGGYGLNKYDCDLEDIGFTLLRELYGKDVEKWLKSRN